MIIQVLRRIQCPAEHSGFPKCLTKLTHVQTSHRPGTPSNGQRSKWLRFLWPDSGRLPLQLLILFSYCSIYVVTVCVTFLFWGRGRLAPHHPAQWAKSLPWTTDTQLFASLIVQRQIRSPDTHFIRSPTHTKLDSPLVLFHLFYRLK